MKLLSALIFLILISSNLYAKTENYNCKLVDQSHLSELATFQKLPLNDKAKMLVSFDKCELTPVTANFDICKVEDTTLVIGINPTQSVLVTNTGKVYEFSCYEYDDSIPEEEQEPKVEEPTEPSEDEEEEQEQQQQQQQQQQQRGEPGHGGSNIRARGKVKAQS